MPPEICPILKHKTIHNHGCLLAALPVCEENSSYHQFQSEITRRLLSGDKQLPTLFTAPRVFMFSIAIAECHGPEYVDVICCASCIDLEQPQLNLTCAGCIVIFGPDHQNDVALNV